jgi:hypothetical protein
VASVSPASSAITWPPVNAARSPRWWIRRWPKPGARTRDGLERAVLVVGDQHPERRAVDLLGQDHQRPRDFMTASSVGMRSCGCEIGSAS